MYSIREVPKGLVLERNGEFVACDVPIMREFFAHTFKDWYGHVLTTGLGLGVAARMLCDLPDVDHVTVIEESLTLINAMQLDHPKLMVIEADAWYYRPEKRFHFAFHDIWSELPLTHGPEQMLAAIWRSYVDVQQVCLPTAYTEFLNGAICNP